MFGIGPMAAFANLSRDVPDVAMFLAIAARTPDLEDAVRITAEECASGTMAHSVDPPMASSSILAASYGAAPGPCHTPHAYGNASVSDPLSTMELCHGIATNAEMERAANKVPALAACLYIGVVGRHPSREGWFSVADVLASKKRFQGISTAAACAVLRRDVHRRSGHPPKWAFMVDGGVVYVRSIRK